MANVPSLRVTRWLLALLPGAIALLGAIAGNCPAAHPAQANDLALPVIDKVELQPLQSQARRVAAALEAAGTPLTSKQQQALDKALAEADPKKGVRAIQEVLDPLCLLMVNVNPESRVKVREGAAPHKLIEHGWSIFLVKVHNEAGVTAPLTCTSPNAQRLVRPSTNSPEPKPEISAADVVQRWLDVAVANKQPLGNRLSGLEVEYRLLEMYSRDAGRREAKLAFDVGQGTQDLDFRNELDLLFECRPAVKVALTVLDDGGKPTMGQFVFRDALGRVYPARSRRLAPDFFFHDQIYRHDGETVSLPPGEYNVTYTRGPEYEILNRFITVPQTAEHKESFQLKRWIDLTKLNWYSGDHHVHAAGCAHYDAPTEGVEPGHMMRHVVGEDLNVGCILTWGPCWYHQKQYFEGKPNKLSTPENLLRYDIEVSGFPSSHCGHLSIIRMKEDDYPGTTRIDQWPSWNLPILRWGQKQGAVVGYSHSGWGLAIKENKLLSYEMPPFDGIGANDFIMTGALGACDFISAVDTPVTYEMNIWYHMLNCGVTTRISGETDFPCIYGERVGLGRSYVKLPAGSPLDFDHWAEGIKAGRSYVSDGISHLADFKVGNLEVGQPGHDGKPSVLAAEAGKKLTVTARVAAMAPEKADPKIAKAKVWEKPYWHIERARIEGTRKVPVELIVNGQPIARQEIEADGKLRDVTFEFTPTRSSWAALRIYPSSHTNPIFVEVDGKPIRADRQSAEWCIKGVEVCWKAKERAIRDSEKKEARAAYDEAAAYYRKVLAETP